MFEKHRDIICKLNKELHDKELIVNWWTYLTIPPIRNNSGHSNATESFVIGLAEKSPGVQAPVDSVCDLLHLARMTIHGVDSEKNLSLRKSYFEF